LILAYNAFRACGLTYLVVNSSNDVFVSELTFVRGNVDCDGLVAVELANGVDNLSSGDSIGAIVGVKVSGEIESGACHFLDSSCNARKVLCENVSEDVEVNYSTNSEEAF
jgi:hypothetical protein